MISFGEVAAPMKAIRPTIPSLPMVATSMAAPSSMMVMAEIMPRMGISLP